MSQNTPTLVNFKGQDYLHQDGKLRPVTFGESFDVHTAPGVTPFFSNGTTHIRVNGGKVTPVSAADVSRVLEHSAEYERQATKQREAEFKTAENRQKERLAKIAKLSPKGAARSGRSG